MIKLVASDIDGTLVKDGTMEINPEVFDVFEKLHDKGIYVAVASGRHWISIEYLFDKIKDKIFYISNNGGYIGMHGRTLFFNAMDSNIVKELIKDARKIPNIDILLSTADGDYSDTKNQQLLDLSSKGYHVPIHQVDDLLELDKPVNKAALYYDGDITPLVVDIRKKYSDKIKLNLSGKIWLDAGAPGVSKGSAIKELQRALGIKKEETMVFGDQENDIPMLEAAYYSYAVANAVDAAKKAARFETASNIDDGVLKILRGLL